jgi:hypothetical protein
MASTPETQSSFDDVVEIVAPAFPLVVSAAFTGRSPTVAIARAFRVDGGGDITIRTAAGQSRALTGISDPYFLECKISQVTSATAATKIVLFV